MCAGISKKILITLIGICCVATLCFLITGCSEVGMKEVNTEFSNTTAKMAGAIVGSLEEDNCLPRKYLSSFNVYLKQYLGNIFALNLDLENTIKSRSDNSYKAMQALDRLLGGANKTLHAQDLGLLFKVKCEDINDGFFNTILCSSCKILSAVNNIMKNNLSENCRNHFQSLRDSVTQYQSYCKENDNSKAFTAPCTLINNSLDFYNYKKSGFSYTLSSKIHTEVENAYIPLAENMGITKIPDSIDIYSKYIGACE